MVVDGDVVRIADGQVSGTVHVDGVLSFLGIPYALPPVGPTLLAAPQPPLPWEGVRPATSFGPIPPQPVPPFPSLPAWRADAGDDILTVNVWLPEQRGAGLPVLVWIYGGGYTNGCADMYDPTALVQAGLVVVSFNYRLGVAGFAHVVLAQCQGDPAAGLRRHVPTVFSPVVDGASMPTTPLRASAAGATADVDLLLCHTVDEFRLFSMTGAAPQVGTDAELAQVAAEVGMSEALDRYRATAPGATVPDLYGMIMTDFFFGEYATRLAEATSRAGGRSFLARFGWRSPAFGGALGACHGADLPFVFGDLLPDNPISAMLVGGSATAGDWALAARMVNAWAAFATKGDPGWPAVRTWDVTDSLDIDPGPGVGRRAVWSEIDFPPVDPGATTRPA